MAGWDGKPFRQFNRKALSLQDGTEAFPTDSVIPRNIAASLFCALLPADRLRREIGSDNHNSYIVFDLL